MKVVLFCGGLGLRLRDYSAEIPKPMVPIGYRPVLWHVMRYYAHYRHRDFVLCLGCRADQIKNYFLNYSEAMSNDFVLSGGGRDLDLKSRDIDDWRITFADTGFSSNIGTRLLAARKYLEDDEVFLANYADGLTDVPLPDVVETFMESGRVACFLSVRPPHSSHVIATDESGLVTACRDFSETDLWINGGYSIFHGLLDQLGTCTAARRSS